MNRILYLAPLFFLVGCAGMSTAETVGVTAAGVTAGGTFLAELFGVIKPFLKPEQVAEVGQHLATAQSWAEGLTRVVGVFGEQLGSVAAQAQEAQQAAEAAQGSGITTTEAGAWGAGILATSRAISAGQRAARRAKRAEAEAKT